MGGEKYLSFISTVVISAIKPNQEQPRTFQIIDLANFTFLQNPPGTKNIAKFHTFQNKCDKKHLFFYVPWYLLQIVKLFLVLHINDKKEIACKLLTKISLVCNTSNISLLILVKSALEDQVC